MLSPKGYRKLIKLLQKPRKFFYWFISSNRPKCTHARLHQPCHFTGKGSITLGACEIGVWPSPYFLSGHTYIEARAENASVRVGDGTFINNSAVIIADKSEILIGNNVLIGHNFFACDSDFHGLEVQDRLNGNYITASVTIADNVFIGQGVSVLKGVCIGRNSVIAAGSTVTSDIPENVIAGGIPAKVIKPLAC